MLPARDGEEAVRVACDRRPDAVVLDVEMPKLDGCAVTRRSAVAVVERLRAAVPYGQTCSVGIAEW